MFYVIQRPTSQEDEGRHLLLAVFSNRPAASDFIDTQVAASGGYYRRGSYDIAVSSVDGPYICGSCGATSGQRHRKGCIKEGMVME